MNMKNWIAAATLAACALSAFAQSAPVKVEVAWMRPAGAGQQSSAAYMTLTAQQPLTLLGADTPAANIVELHEMKMEGDVMKMRAADTLPLAPGKPLQLKPGGFHFMLMDLPRPIAAGTHMRMTLRFRDARGKELKQAVTLPVRATPP